MGGYVIINLVFLCDFFSMHRIALKQIFRDIIFVSLNGKIS